MMSTRCEQSLNQSVTQLITSVATLVGVFIMMLRISVADDVWWPCASCRYPADHRQHHGQAFPETLSSSSRHSLGNVNGHVEEMYGGHNIVKAFNGEEHSDQDVRARSTKNCISSAWKSPVPLRHDDAADERLSGNLGYVRYAWSGRILAVNGRVTVGRHPGVYPVCAQLHTADPADRTTSSNVLQSDRGGAPSACLNFWTRGRRTARSRASLVRLEHDPGLRSYLTTSTSAMLRKRSSSTTFPPSSSPGTQVAIVGPTGAGKDHHGQAADAFL